MTFAVDIPCVLSVFIYDLPTEAMKEKIFSFTLPREAFQFMHSYGYDWLYNSDFECLNYEKNIYNIKMGVNGYL